MLRLPRCSRERKVTGSPVLLGNLDLRPDAHTGHCWIEHRTEVVWKVIPLGLEKILGFCAPRWTIGALCS